MSNSLLFSTLEKLSETVFSCVLGTLEFLSLGMRRYKIKAVSANPAPGASA